MGFEHENSLETALMEQMRAGRVEALQQLYELYSKELFAFFYRLERDHHRAEDALQELFFRVWKARERYCPTAAVRTFLYTIARNLWINQSQKRRRSPVNESIDLLEPAVQASAPSAPGPTPLEEAQTSEALGHLLQALAGLPAEQRMAFVMAHYQGMRYTEIADVMEVPIGTVKSRIANAGARLRKSIGEMENRTDRPTNEHSRGSL